MDDFPFLLNLNYKMSDFEIKPPSNLYQLKEIATSKYDLKIAEMYYVTEDGEERELITEEDYLDLIQYATDSNLEQVEIIIKKNENISEKRKESLRKKSSMKNEYEQYSKSKKSKLSKIKDEDEYEEEDLKNDDDDEDDDEEEGNNYGSKGVKESCEEMGMQCEYDYFGDTRNKKGMNDEGYTKQNKGFKEDRRINYIKEKKKRQREEDLKKNRKEEEEEVKIDKNRKRIKKEINEDDEDYGNNASEVGAKNNKKKKKPKKDRVRF